MNEPRLKVMGIYDIYPTAKNRRGLNHRPALALAFLLSLLVFGLILGWVIYRFALPTPRYFLVGSLETFALSQEPYYVRAERGFFLVNTGQELIALSTKPPHRAFRNCFIRWDAERGDFTEGCGGARFELDGSYRAGPTPREMDRYPLWIEEGQIWVDTNGTIPGEPVE